MLIFIRAISLEQLETKTPLQAALKFRTGIMTCGIGTRADKEANDTEWESKNSPTRVDRFTHLIYVRSWCCRAVGKGRHFQNMMLGQ